LILCCKIPDQAGYPKDLYLKTHGTILFFVQELP
jgi:hypothetical protein